MLGFAAALVAGAAVFVLLLPLIQGTSAPLDRAAHEPDEIRARRRVLLRGIRDAEYDFVTGKLDETDYTTLKADLAQETLELIDGGEEAPSTPGFVSARASGVGPGSGPSVVREGCASCGARLRSGSRFCSECGTAVFEGSAGPPGSNGGKGSGRSG